MLHLVHFNYYCANYAVIVLPSQTSGDMIFHVRSYQAEIGSETSRLCGLCLCINRNPLACYNFGCIEPHWCGCAICRKTPSSLKSLASEIVFGLCNKQKSCFDNLTTCTPLEILELPDDALLHMMFSETYKLTEPLIVKCATYLSSINPSFICIYLYIYIFYLFSLFNSPGLENRTHTFVKLIVLQI